MRQPLPGGGDQASLQDLANQSFDPTMRTFLVQLLRTEDGVNAYLDGTPRTQRYDLQSPVYYIGSAPMDALDTDSTWTITKYDLTNNPYAAKVVTGVQWANRATASYR
jgi:hypothetical protein